MQIAHIAPVSVMYSGLLDHEECQMAIASEVLINPAYAKWFRQSLSFVILDVPTYETSGKDAFSFSSLSEAIELSGADEVVLPDIWEPPFERNIDLAIESALVLGGGIRRLMAVPHASSLDQYLEITSQMVKIPGVQTIGVAQRVEKEFGVPRPRVVSKIAECFPEVSLHLLGIMRDMNDISAYQVHETVRSLDTIKFVRWGLNGQFSSIQHIPPCPGRGENYFNWTVTQTQLRDIASNVAYWDGYCEARSPNGKHK